MPESRLSLENLENRGEFIHRHIAPSDADIASMLEAIGLDSLDDLVEKAIPSSIISNTKLNIAAPRTEQQALADLGSFAARNQVFKSMLGMGYSDCHTPTVILRNILENPGWYTAYTPYQPEISQGRMEALLNFQTMIMDLTGMEIANASLLDEGTAAAEAMTMVMNASRNKGRKFFISKDCHPQTIEVVRTRAEPQDIEVVVGDHREGALAEDVFGVLLQYPATDGEIFDYADFAARAHETDALVVVAADILALALLKPPGEFGADVVVGNSQRFGVPLGFGGPHAAYLATKEQFKRAMPGRIVGVSIDADEKPALRFLCRRESSIYAASAPRATYARPRFCWPSSRACTASTTARKASSGSRREHTASHARWPTAWKAWAALWRRIHFSIPWPFAWAREAPPASSRKRRSDA